MPKTVKLDATGGTERSTPEPVSEQYPPIPENPLQALHALNARQDDELWARINYHQGVSEAVDEHYHYKLFVGDLYKDARRVVEHMRIQQGIFNYISEDWRELMRRARWRQEHALLTRMLTAEPQTRILADVGKREKANRRKRATSNR